MPISPYIAEIRSRIGTDLLLLPSAAAVIRNDVGRVLLGKLPGLDMWNLPSGHADPGESPAQTAVRETLEETGLHVTPTALLGVVGGLPFRHVYPNGDTVESTILVFECRVDRGILHPADGELEALRYFAPDAFPPLAVPWPPELFSGSSTPYFC